MEILEILTTVAKYDLCFTCNNAVLSVPLDYPSVLPENGLLFNANQGTLFRLLDHITVVSIGLVMPLNFQLYPYTNDSEPRQWAVFPMIDLSAREALSGNQHQIIRFVLPFSDYELNLNIYENFGPLDVLQSFQLRALCLVQWNNAFDYSSPRVSMVNSPDSLNGIKFTVPIFAKIIHNIPITAIP